MMIEELPGKYHKYFAVLAGPSFAKEIMDGEPTNVVVASQYSNVATQVAEYVSDGSALRAYVSDDVHGIEIAGAVKNVLAIASGALDGLNFGNNARAALVCRGLAELTRLAVATGSNGRSMAGLAGVGDLMLTCSSSLSRNFTVGKKLASGMTLDEISGGTNAVAEGVATAKSVRMLADKLNVEMPICEAVYQVLYEGKAPKVALAELQARPLGAEGGLVAEK
jgi:glycerol-3-phosphate dehydrogenase